MIWDHGKVCEMVKNEEGELVQEIIWDAVIELPHREGEDEDDEDDDDEELEEEPKVYFSSASPTTTVDEPENEVHLRGGLLVPEDDFPELEEGDDEDEDEPTLSPGEFVMELTIEYHGSGSSRFLENFFAAEEDDEADEEAPLFGRSHRQVPGSFPGAEEEAEPDSSRDEESSRVRGCWWPGPSGSPTPPPSPSIPGEFTTTSTEVGDEHLRALEEGTGGEPVSLPQNRRFLTERRENGGRGAPVRRRRQQEGCPSGCFGCTVCEGEEEDGDVSSLDLEAGEG